MASLTNSCDDLMLIEEPIELIYTINNEKIEISNNKSFIKKIFIKICRIFGFEIIDQATFKSPTLGKDLNETLSVPGKKVYQDFSWSFRYKKKSEIN